MIRLLQASALALLIGLASGCANSGTSTSGSATTSSSTSASSRAALCSSLDALQASVAKLKNVQISKSTLTTVTDDLAAVKADLQRVVADAKSQYQMQVTRLQVDVTAVQAAVDAARAAPSTVTLGGVRIAISHLFDDVKSAVNEVKPTC